MKPSCSVDLHSTGAAVPDSVETLRGGISKVLFCLITSRNLYILDIQALEDYNFL